MQVQRTAEEFPTFGGTRWVSGRWCNVYSDGTILPVLDGHDDDDTDPPGKGGKGDDDEEEEDEEEEDDDDAKKGKGDDDDDDDDDLKDVKNPKDRKRIKELSDENADKRVKIREARAARDDFKAKLDKAQERIKELEKSGGSDETLKTRVTELETDVATKDKEISDLKSKVTKNATEAKVVKVADDLRIAEDIGIVMYQLERANMLEVDEDGDVEDLKPNIRKLVKQKKLTVQKVASGDDEEGSDDDDAASGASRKSASKPFNGSKSTSKSSGYDKAALAKKFPALDR